MRIDLEAERAILITAMLRPELCAELKLKSAEFASSNHGDIWDAIESLNADSKPCEPLAVIDYLQRLGKTVLVDVVMGIMTDSHPTSQPEHYVAILKKNHSSRMALEIAHNLSENPSNINGAIEALMALQDRSAQGSEWTIKQAVQRAHEATLTAFDQDGKLIGVPTGLTLLDDFLGGFHNSDLIILGGRASMGKTSLLLNCVKAAAEDGCPVGVISGEQPMDQMGSRAISLASNVPAHLLRNGKLLDEHWGYMTSGIKQLMNLPIWIYDASAPSLSDVARLGRKWVHKHGMKALYVDYLQRITATGEDRKTEVGRVARGLKNLARDLNIPVIALAQVNRLSEQSSDKRPRISHLSDSSEIEKEADQIILIYRDEYYNPLTTLEPGIAELLIEKNRHGPTGRAKVRFVQNLMKFTDL